MEAQTYRVEGMTCGGCVRHVDKALRAVAGVTEVAVDLAQGTVTVSGTAPFSALAAQVDEAGYRMIPTA